MRFKEIRGDDRYQAMINTRNRLQSSIAVKFDNWANDINSYAFVS